MSNLKDIQERHGWDRWKDVAFICAAVLMTALALGSVTSRAAGSTSAPKGHVEVVYSGFEIQP